MQKSVFENVDNYLSQQLLGKDSAFEEALERQHQANLPAINVTPLQGKMLYLFAKMIGAKKILEIGTLGGYSTMWLSKALPEDGKIISLEINEKHAEVAKRNLQSIVSGSKAQIIMGHALGNLQEIHAKGLGPFDLVFIDADKENNPGYFEWAIRLAHSGTVIIVDNVVRNGRVLDSKSEDLSVLGTRELLGIAGREERIDATAIQTVGNKGHDGFLIAWVT